MAQLENMHITEILIREALAKSLKKGGQMSHHCFYFIL